MPKPKSEKTLAKEAIIAAQVAKYEIQVNSLAGIVPKVLKGKIKSPDEDVVIRKVKWTPYAAGALRRLRKDMELKQGFVFSNVQNSYIFGRVSSMEPLGIVFPGGLSSVPRRRTFNGLELITYPGDKDPILQISVYPYTDNAVAFTWPDELGNGKVYMHVRSQFLASKLPQLVPKGEHDGLNRKALEGCDDWRMLSGYIDIRQKIHNIPVQTVCDIVKTISLNLLKQEQAEEAKKMGGAGW